MGDMIGDFFSGLNPNGRLNAQLGQLGNSLGQLGLFNSYGNVQNAYNSIQNLAGLQNSFQGLQGQPYEEYFWTNPYSYDLNPNEWEKKEWDIKFCRESKVTPQDFYLRLKELEV